MKYCLWNIFIPSPKLIVPGTKINLQEETRPLEMIEQVIYYGNLLPVIHIDFVELPIIDTHPKGSIHFFHKPHMNALREYARLDEALICEIS